MTRRSYAYAILPVDKPSPHESELDRLIALRCANAITEREYLRDVAAVKRAMAAEGRR